MNSSLPMALDVASFAQAMLYLAEESGCDWLPKWNNPNKPPNSQQRYLTEWFNNNFSAIKRLRNLGFKTFQDSNKLRAYLNKLGHGKIWVQSIAADELSVIATSDFVINLGAIAEYTKSRYQGFEFDKRYFRVYAMRTQNDVVRIELTPRLTLWLTVSARPEPNSLEVFNTAEVSMGALNETLSIYETVTIPNFKIDIGLFVPWIEGLDGGKLKIKQAFQTYKLLFKTSGRPKPVDRKPNALYVNQPFTGWFTQKDSCVPIAPFFVPENAWE